MKLDVLISGILVKILHGLEAFYIPTYVIKRSDIKRRHFHASLLAFQLMCSEKLYGGCVRI